MTALLSLGNARSCAPLMYPQQLTGPVQKMTRPSPIFSVVVPTTVFEIDEEDFKKNGVHLAGCVALLSWLAWAASREMSHHDLARTDRAIRVTASGNDAAQGVGWSRRKTGTYLKALEALGYIKHHANPGAPSTYTLLWPAFIITSSSNTQEEGEGVVEDDDMFWRTDEPGAPPGSFVYASRESVYRVQDMAVEALNELAHLKRQVENERKEREQETEAIRRVLQQNIGTLTALQERSQTIWPVVVGNNDALSTLGDILKDINQDNAATHTHLKHLFDERLPKLIDHINISIAREGYTFNVARLGALAADWIIRQHGDAAIADEPVFDAIAKAYENLRIAVGANEDGKELTALSRDQLRALVYHRWATPDEDEAVEKPNAETFEDLSTFAQPDIKFAHPDESIKSYAPKDVSAIKSPSVVQTPAQNTVTEQANPRMKQHSRGVDWGARFEAILNYLQRNAGFDGCKTTDILRALEETHPELDLTDNALRKTLAKMRKMKPPLVKKKGVRSSTRYFPAKPSTRDASPIYFLTPREEARVRAAYKKLTPSQGPFVVIADLWKEAGEPSGRPRFLAWLAKEGDERRVSFSGQEASAQLGEAAWAVVTYKGERYGLVRFDTDDTDIPF